MQIVPRSLLALTIAGCALPALGYESGDMILRFGPALVAPHSSSDSSLGDVVEVEDSLGVGISGTYMLNEQFGIELLGALPFEHDIEGTGALDGVTIGTTRQLPPTLLVNFYPRLSDRFQPFLGAGVNYTTFFHEDTDAQLDAALAGNTDLALKDSVGLALELGVDVPLRDNIMFSFTVWNVDIDTEARVKVNGAPAAKIDVEIDPWVYMAGIGIKF